MKIRFNINGEEHGYIWRNPFSAKQVPRIGETVAFRTVVDAQEVWETYSVLSVEYRYADCEDDDRIHITLVG